MALMVKLLGVLVVVGFVLHYFWWLLAGMVLWYLVQALRGAWARHQLAAEAWEQEQRQIALRADKQHSQILSGDERGLWGVAWPAMQKYQKVTK